MASSDNESESPSPPLFTRHQYASENILQNYEVYIPPSSSSNPSTDGEGEGDGDTIWLVHIHGGAWRDPMVRAGDFLLPTLTQLLNASSAASSSSPSAPFHASPSFSPSFLSDGTPSPITSKIAGFISLDYRLSPHISYPQDQDSTPDFFLREARHPDHISDILTALRGLQRKYGFGGRYVIVGHSCGGTLGWQVAMSRSWRGDGYPVGDCQGREVRGDGVEVLDFEDVQPPMAIVSVCTIYDLPLLVQTHGDVPAYRQFTSAAFGKDDERLWRVVSPARWPNYADTWNAGEDGDGDGSTRKKKRRKRMVAVLAHSRDDELVDWVQVERMEKELMRMQHRDGAAPGWNGDFHLLELKGRHQEVWQKGKEMARAINVAMEMLDRAE